MSKVKVRLRTLTPRDAEALLEKNSVNRKVRPTLVSRYSKDMAAGRWELNGETIITNGDGTLANGQHRLLACIEAGVPFETLFVEGVDLETMQTIDIGASRTPGDTLGWMNIPNPVLTSSAANLVLRYDQGGKQLAAGYKVTRNELIDFVVNNPGVVRSSEFAEEIRGKIPANKSIIAAVHFLLARHVGSENEASLFFELVANGSDIKAPSVLREWLLNRQGVSKRPAGTIYMAYMIKSAKAWATGEPIHRLSWKRDATRDKREAFPRF